MVDIEVSHIFPVSVSEAFAYITDIQNWPEYWPNFVRIENPSEAQWSNPGDKVTVVLKFLNRERAMKMDSRSSRRICESFTSVAKMGYPTLTKNAIS